MPLGASAPSPYPDLGGEVGINTKTMTPGKMLAQVCNGNRMGVKVYLAERGDINAQLDEGELAVMRRELGGDSARGNPYLASKIGDVELDDTALHIAVRHKDVAMVKYLLSHGAEMHIRNSVDETAVSLGAQHCIDVRSNFKIEGRVIEIFDMIDENKDGWVNEPEVIKFALLTSDNDEENAYAFWRVLQTMQGGQEAAQGLVSKKTWTNFFLTQFANLQVMPVLAQLQEVLDDVSRINGQAVGQSILASRTTPLRTLHHQHWVAATRASWAPADRRVTAESYRPRSSGHPFVPLFF
jgi:hypothetical protein